MSGCCDDGVDFEKLSKNVLTIADVVSAGDSGSCAMLLALSNNLL